MPLVFLAVSVDLNLGSETTAEQCFTAKQIPMHKLSCSQGWLKEQLTTLQSVPMSEKLQGSISTYLSTLSSGDSLAKTSHVPEKVLACGGRAKHTFFRDHALGQRNQAHVLIP